MRLKDQVAIVTGAASGMGRALCLSLAREGASLGLLDRNGDGLATLAAELEKNGCRCASAVADLRNRKATGTALQALAENLGPVDVLVACAGITGVTLVDDLAIDDMEAIVQVNLLGVAYAIEAVLPGMLARGRGQIVGISSLAGCRGMPYSAAYSASKAGLAAFLESLRPALRRRGIVVTTVLPGFVRTPLMQTARAQPPVAMMEPEEAARHITRAILRRCRVYSFPWTTSLVVGILRWLPASVFDWAMARAASKIPNVQY